MTRSPFNLCAPCLRNLRINSRLTRLGSPIRVFPQKRNISSQQFEPFVPPPPNSLPEAAPPRQYRKLRRWARRLGYLALGLGVAYGVDRQFYASSIRRSVHTFGLGLLVALDYKINFRENPPFVESIEALHRRNAERLSDLIRANGGLYLKIGQAVAMQSAVLPPEFQKMFARMFDDAPQNGWKDVEKVILEDFGKSPEEVFGISFTGDPEMGVMERTARASASVAQVHWARLKDGREVAVKIQKREIASQVGWDLWAFKYVNGSFTTYMPYITNTVPQGLWHTYILLFSKFRYIA